ncbi:MAG: GatB/YqeY domain-containing protein [Candidatus Microgenomates bacterium]|jgi:uncharacterized protein YqeY
MIADNITKMIGEALKAHDELRLSTLRMLSSALNYGFIEKQHKLNDEEEIAVVKKEAKMRKDAIEAYEKAGAIARADKERQELKILQEFLPVEMSDEELKKLVSEAIKMADLPAGATHQALQAGMGKVIGLVMAKAKGRADGSKVAQLVKSHLG